MNGKKSRLTIDKLKPAYVITEDDQNNSPGKDHPVEPEANIQTPA